MTDKPSTTAIADVDKIKEILEDYRKQYATAGSTMNDDVQAIEADNAQERATLRLTQAIATITEEARQEVVQNIVTGLNKFPMGYTEHSDRKVAAEMMSAFKEAVTSATHLTNTNNQSSKESKS